MHHVTIQEAEAHFAGILSEVRNGEEVVLTDHDMPVVKMTPLAEPQKRRGLFGSLKRHPQFGSGKDLITFIADDFDETPEDFKDYM